MVVGAVVVVEVVVLGVVVVVVVVVDVGKVVVVATVVVVKAAAGLIIGRVFPLVVEVGMLTVCKTGLNCSHLYDPGVLIHL